MNINGNLKFLGQGVAENFRFENLATDPVAPYVGQMWYNTTDKAYRGHDGTVVITFASGGNTATLQTEIDAVEAAVGLNANGTLAAITGTNYINGSGTIKAAVFALDGQAKTTADAVAAEVTRATGAEGTLTTNLASEVTRATAAEGVIASDLASEITRATGAEGANATAISTETSRATTAEGTLTTNLATEVSRATAAEGVIAGNLATEITRATGVEGTLTTNLAAEVTRAAAAEVALGVRVDGVVTSVSAEVTRATAAETTLQTNVDAKVAKSGDTMSGTLSMGGHSITNLAAPVSGTDAVNRIYVDNKIAGLSWKDPVLQILADHTTATGLVAGNRIYDSTDLKIYTYDGTIFDAGVALNSADAFFDKATDFGYVFNGTAAVQFTGGGQIVAGVGLSKTGNQLDVNLGAGIAQLPTDEVGIDVLTTGGLFLTVDGTTTSTNTAAQVAIKLADSTLTVGAGGLKVSTSVTDAIAANATAIGAEVTRATAAEGILTTNLAAEVTRATGAEGTLTTNLAAEVTRATAAEGANATAITAENTRALAAEGVIAGNLTTEIARATAAEGANATAIGAEVTRATAAEGTLTTNLAAEVTRATAAEGTLTTNLAAEVTRATAAEGAINGRIEAGFFVYTGGSAATSHVVTHNIGSKYNNVTVVDSADQVVIAQSITFDSTTQLTVTFNTAITCKVIVSGLNPLPG